MSTPLQNDIAQMAYHHRRRWLFFKEVLLLLLVGLVAGLSMYVARDNHSALGLLPARPALAEQLPVITSFRSAALISEPFLELDIRESAHAEQQVSGTVFDPTNPPPVEQFSVLNTRVGGEVALFWTLPEGVEEVSIYRTTISNPDDVSLERRDVGNEKSVAEGVTDQWYREAGLTDGVVYQYRVVSLSTYEDTVYESAVGSVDAIIPSDEVAPQAPANVTVRTSTIDGEAALEVLWTHPDNVDFDQVRVYRSAVYNDRGEEVAVVQANQTAAYLDEDVAPNETYYYTVVAYDVAGNASSTDFQAVAPGNANPFEPFTINPVTGEVTDQ